MPAAGPIPPKSLAVEETATGIAVDYRDGRRTVFTATPEPTKPPVRASSGRNIHILEVTPEFDSGRLLSVNDHDSDADVFTATGVGRIIVSPEETKSVLSGLALTMDGHSVIIDTQESRRDHRVFVFEEDMYTEAAFELVNEGGT